MTTPRPPLSSVAVLSAVSLLCGSPLPGLTVEMGEGGGPLIAAGEEWSYFKGTTAPSDPADAWQEVPFDDSGWSIGASGFGYGDGDDQTVLDDMRQTTTEDGYASLYIRKTFDLASVPAGGLELVIDYDDGFVAYLNGVEVQRSSNMPAGPPTFSTTANPTHEAGTPETFVLGNAADLLIIGTNVLAIEGHNGSLDSSDFSLIPSLRTTSGLVRNGDTWIVRTATPAVGGTVQSGAATSVTVNGVAVNYDQAAQRWDAAPTISPGVNSLLVEARVGGTVVESETVEVVYLPAANEISGTLIESATWSGAVLLDGPVTVPAGLVLAIAPGTQVFLEENASLVVNGQLLAEGTQSEPIRFTHYGEGTTWERLLLVGADDSRLLHCIVEFSDCEGDHKDYYDDDCDDATPPPSPRTYFQAVVVIACHVDIEDCLFQNLPDDSADAEGDAIAIISDDPEVPGVATANIRRSDFIGIGQGVHTRFSPVVVEECFFTGHNGDNDDIDLYGESSPVPLILNNRCINPGHDDMINPTRCSAILIGNVIAGSDDHGIVLRDKCKPILINNLIYNCSSGGIAIQNQCDALLINNTIVDCGRGIRCFDHTGRWGPPYCLFPGSGSATLINCIIWDCPTTFTLENSPWEGDRGSHLTVSNCNVEGGQGAASISSNSTLTWGAGNIDAEPRFLDESGGDFRLQSAAGRWDAATASWLVDAFTSPSIDAGMDVRTTYPELAAWLARDFDGIGRPLDGNGDATPGIDMGAHEVITETVDSSGDGIPDSWGFRYGLNSADPELATGNPDGDRNTTGEEWMADTDPTDPNSFFALSEVVFEDPVVVSYRSSAGRVYTLQASGDLLNWDDVPNQVEIPGSGGVDSLSGPRQGSRQFYRVSVEVP